MTTGQPENRSVPRKTTIVASGRLLRPRILVVEDDRSSRYMLQGALGARGCQVLTVENALLATNLLDQMTFDLILSDYRMPIIDGLSFFERLRENPKFRDIPFIFLSAFADSKQRANALRLGAEDFLVKPINLDELVIRIAKVLQRAKTRRKLSQMNKTVLQGAIDVIHLDQVLHMVEAMNLTGTLEIQPPGNDPGFMYVIEGKLAGARFGSREGLAAVAVLLGVPSGRFAFTSLSELPDDAQRLPQPISLDTLQVELPDHTPAPVAADPGRNTLGDPVPMAITVDAGAPTVARNKEQTPFKPMALPPDFNDVQ
ncbi:MAG TPA: response regulator [Planctomycetota bacterium]|nr:response regulator [Planctomycetota bacterium]